MTPDNETLKKDKGAPRGPFGRGGMGPGGRMMGGGQKAKNLKGTLRKLVGYMRPYRWSIILVFFFAIASTIFTVIGPKILGKATTKLFEGIVGHQTIRDAGNISHDHVDSGDDARDIA